MKGHWSGCAVQNAAAFSVGPCNCGGLEFTDDALHSLVAGLVPESRGVGFFVEEGPTLCLIKTHQLPTDRFIVNAPTPDLIDPHVFDSATTPDQVIRRALEAMKAYNGSWVLLPGNHDPALSESPWTRIERIGRPANVILVL